MRRVVIVAFDEAQSLDITGPAEAFSIATRFFGAEYRLELVTPGGGPARCSSGLSLNADAAIDDVRGAGGTLLVAGGAGAHRVAADPRVIAWLVRTARKSRRAASICTRALLPAQPRLVDRRRAP